MKRDHISDNISLFRLLQISKDISPNKLSSLEELLRRFDRLLMDFEVYLRLEADFNINTLKTLRGQISFLENLSQIKRKIKITSWPLLDNADQKDIDEVKIFIASLMKATFLVSPSCSFFSQISLISPGNTDLTYRNSFAANLKHCMDHLNRENYLEAFLILESFKGWEKTFTMPALASLSRMVEKQFMNESLALFN